MPHRDISQVSQEKYIIIQGAKVHNLQNVSLAIPRNKMVVITGLSGSGKSSLAFDTLYAEGQRRYVESLSSYARQFLGKLDKPDVENIRGISPAIAIEQKVTSRSARSTVGTSTEIYTYLKLLFARIGRTISPVSGNEVKRHSVTDVVNFFTAQPPGSTVLLFSPIHKREGRSLKEHLSILMQQGYTRIKSENDILRIDDLLQGEVDEKKDYYLIIDRLVATEGDEENESRFADSVQTAFFEGNGTCLVEVNDKENITTHSFSDRFELDGITFEIPDEHFFSFNNPVGACKTCEGFGSVIGIDPDLVIPDKSLSVFQDAIVPWRGEKMEEWKNELLYSAEKFDFPVHRPYSALTPAQKELLWTGNRYFSGLKKFFKYLESKSYKIQYRVMLSRYRGKTPCPDCKGTRLRSDAAFVKVDGFDIMTLITMPVAECLEKLKNIQLTEYEKSVADRLLVELTTRLQFLKDVGLGYLTLNRLSNTLSGGESQRIKLASCLGSSLVGSMYILDEPSIGLHPRDTERLINVMLSLRDLGNTVIVVEHDEEVMKAADEIIDMGPLAGRLGGRVVFQGNHHELLTSEESYTAKYLTGRMEIKIPNKRRSWKKAIEIKGARENNLKNIDVAFPLNVLNVITGVSGSGKSSLIRNILYPALKKIMGGYGDKSGDFDTIQGDFKQIKAIEFVDQNPIGKSSRSNPVTYVKAFDEIRTLFSKQKLSKVRGYKPGHFSFNVKGGRCETCEGEGVVKIEMQFMADIFLTCEVCKGKRYKPETLEIKYRDKNISDVLDLTIDEAIDFFGEDKKEITAKKILEKLQPLQDVGLGYVQLGQNSNTLSGGEAQRIKLASFLSRGKGEAHTLFIFDEPTTGLHFHDIQKLLDSFNALLNNGHSLVVIEHNTDIIKSADWVIDLGPEGGDKGGFLIFSGTPDELVHEKNSYTGKYLGSKLSVLEK